MKADFGSYLEQLGKERFKGFIIHDETLSKLTYFAQKAAKKYEGKYIDLLEYFKNHKELSSTIDIYSLENLMSFLVNESTGQRLIIIHKADFLLDTWSKDERAAFYRMIDNQWDTFKKSMNSVLVFCLHTSEEVINSKISKNRVHHLSNFKAID